MELDHYAHYWHLMGQCIDIVTDIHPHCNSLQENISNFPCDVKEITALDPELSAAQLTIK